MNVKPIPLRLLRDNIVLIYPTLTGALETPIANVRVERSQSIEGYSTSSPKYAAEITVWVDYQNSTWAEFPIGARVQYGGETFEITERKLFSAGIAPHHLKFKARRTGDEVV